MKVCEILNYLVELTIQPKSKGNKSVISKVVPDKEMGRTEDGVIPDIRIDALGVLGRLNSGQCIEQEINWVADTVRQEIIKEDKLDKKFKLLYKFLDIASPDEANKLRDFLGDKSNEYLADFISKIENDMIHVIQSPMYCMTTMDLLKLCKEFKPKFTKMYYTNEYGEEHPAIREMIVADEYILRLKQEPITKFSVRSKSMNNPRTSMPIKSTKAARHKILYPDQCNRLGEQENSILMLSSNYDALDYFLRSHSSSNEARRASDLFEKDPKDGFIINMPTDKSRAVDMLNTYLKAMGNRLTINYDTPQDGPVKAECDIPEIPEYIKKLL